MPVRKPRFEGPDIYQFRLSVRELAKAAWQMKFDVVATIGMHDEFPIPENSIIKYLMNTCYGNKDSRPTSHPLVGVWVFHRKPPQATLDALTAAHFRVMHRPLK